MCFEFSDDPDSERCNNTSRKTVNRLLPSSEYCYVRHFWFRLPEDSGMLPNTAGALVVRQWKSSLPLHKCAILLRKQALESYRASY
jgi:hypothetical protein